MPTAQRVIDDHAELANILGDGSYHLSSAQRTAAIRDATNSQNGLMPSGKLTNWDAAYSHIHNLTTDINHNELAGLLGGTYHTSVTAGGVQEIVRTSAGAAALCLQLRNNSTDTNSGTGLLLIADTSDSSGVGGYILASRNADNSASLTIKTSNADSVLINRITIDGDGDVHIDSGDLYVDNTGIVRGLNGTYLEIGVTDRQLKVVDSVAGRLSFVLKGPSYTLSAMSWDSSAADNPLDIVRGAGMDIHCFSNAATGETKSLRVYGFATGGEKKYLDMAINTDQDLELGVYDSDTDTVAEGFKFKNYAAFDDYVSTTELRTTKINADASGDVNFFGDTDVSAAVDGKAVYFHRKAPSPDSDSYYKFYIDQYMHGWIKFNSAAGKNFKIEATGPILFNAGLGYVQEFGGNGRDSHFGKDGMGSGKNPVIRQYGYITDSTDTRYIQWQVNDGGVGNKGWLQLTREDSGLDGFDVQMPFRCDSLRIDTSYNVGDPTTTGYFVVSLNGTDYRVPCMVAP